MPKRDRLAPGQTACWGVCRASLLSPTAPLCGSMAPASGMLQVPGPHVEPEDSAEQAPRPQPEAELAGGSLQLDAGREVSRDWSSRPLTLCVQDPKEGLLTDVASLRIQTEQDLSLGLFYQ